MIRNVSTNLSRFSRIFACCFIRITTANTEPNDFQSIRELDNNLGLITESIAPLAISNTDWKLIQKLDLSPYFRAGPSLIKTAKLLKLYCKESPYEEEVESLQAQIHDAVQRADNVALLLRGHAESKTPKRLRRSLLPFVGKINRFLFGTLDEEAEADLHRAIEAVAKDTGFAAELLANQTQVVDRRVTDIEDNVHRVTDALSSLTQKLYSSERNAATRATITALTENLLQYRIETETLTDIMLFASRGTIHPRAISPEVIKKAAELTKAAAVDAVFPTVEGAFPIIQIAKISKLTVLASGTQLIFHLAIPLLDVQSFNLFKASPVPTYQEFSNASSPAAYVWPETHYFALSTSGKAYVPLTLDQVNHCKTLGQLYICTNPEPVREVSSNTACEIKLSAGEKSIDTQHCDVRFKQLYVTFWQRMHRANTWLFSTRTPERLVIRCRMREQSTITIKGAGTLELRPGCTANTDNVRITAARTLTDRAPQVYFGQLRLNVTGLLGKMNISQGDMAVVTETVDDESTSRAKHLHGIQVESLGQGAGLREIERKARRLAEYRAMASRIADLSGTTTYFGYSLASVTTFVIILIIVLWAANGKCSRYLDAKRAQRNEVRLRLNELTRGRLVE